jgi:hypothetical protein
LVYGSDVRLELLDGDVTLVKGSEVLSVESAGQREVLAKLALNAPHALTSEELQRHFGINKHTLERRISALRALPGIDIPKAKPPMPAYGLKIPLDRIDALQFMSAVAVAESARTRESIAAALALWRSGPPGDLAGDDMFVEVKSAKQRIDQLEKATARRRVLIVEDKVGEQIRRVLGNYDCTVVRSLDEFWSVESTLERYDLALVDLHLGASYKDESGRMIAEHIARKPIDLPVIVMTLRPPAVDAEEFIARLHLVALVFKHDDSEDSDFSKVAAAVNGLFSSDPKTVVLMKIWGNLPCVLARAKEWIKLDDGDESLMLSEYDDLVRIVQDAVTTRSEGSIAAARGAQSRFEAKYGSPPPLIRSRDNW